MANRPAKSLSTKIVSSIAAIFLIIMVIIFAVFEKVNKAAFYSIEVEKAELIADTIEPLLALDIYLELNQKIDQLALQLIENPNILMVRISKEEEVLNEIISPAFKTNQTESFTISKAILQPNSHKEIGKLELIYSSKHYEELISQYTKLTLYLLLGLGIIFLLLSLYVKRLLSPLRKIARSLKSYSPDNEVHIPFSHDKNEIGLISRALNEMQCKISEYATKQQNINLFLEDKVNEKTRALRRQLYTDSLTGLPNRVQLIEDIQKIDRGSLIIINIDDFKEINDFFGHIAGDNILIKFANRLKNLFTHEDDLKLLARLSGDEFAILLEKRLEGGDFVAFIEKLIFNIENMIFFHENNELSIRATIGGTINMDASLEKADIALKSARKDRKPFLIYDEKLNIEGQYKNNIEWVKKLKYAIDQDRVVPYYQPIFENHTGEIVSYECLMRIIDRSGDVLTPFFFLDIAKKSRLYTKLTKIMIQKSCANFETRSTRFSINLSVEDILDNDIVDYIKQQVETYNVANKIIFEILESEGIENYQQVSHFIGDMKALGCKIAIDDFGSGYSNFEHMLQLNVDYIKIDGTLIKNIHNDQNAEIVVETIIDFAKRLNIKTVAEYVHNEAVHHRVKELGIDRSQGFHLGEPKAQCL